MVHHLPADRDGAAAEVLQAGNHAQRGRFPTAGRPDQDHELVIADGEIEILHGDDGAVALAHVGEDDLGHGQTRKPRSTYFWPNKVTISAGPSASTAVALMRCHSIPSSCTNWAITTVRMGVSCEVRMSANRNSFQV